MIYPSIINMHYILDTIGVQSTDYQSFTMESVGNGGNTFQFSAKGIAWPTDVEKYGVTAYTTSSAAPPINWKTYRGRSLNGSWANADAMFNPLNDEHFQVCAERCRDAIAQFFIKPFVYKHRFGCVPLDCPHSVNCTERIRHRI